MEDKRDTLLRDIRDICENTGEIGDNFTVNEAKTCDKALTKICEMVDEWEKSKED